MAIYNFIGQIKIAKILKFGALAIKREVIYLTLIFSFLLLPFFLFLVNWPKANLANYKLGDWLGHDVLISTDNNSLLFLFDDTLAFNTQYVYYTSSDFRNRKIFFGGLMRHLYYRKQIAQRYPELSIPEGFLTNKNAESGDFIKDLILANLDKYPAYTTYGFNIKIEGKAWIAEGLLAHLVDEDLAKNDDYFREANKRIFEKFKLRVETIPSSYSHFVPDHIKFIYSLAYLNVANRFLDSGASDLAQEYYEKSSRFSREYPDAFIGLGKAYLKLQKCPEAKESFLMALDIDRHNIFVLEQLVKIAKECDKDQIEAGKFQKIFDEEKTRREIKFK